MSASKLALLMSVVAISLGNIASVVADDPLTVEQAVSARQTAMKVNGRAMRRADSLTGDAAIAALQLVEDNYARMPSLFPEGSITDKSLALPIIWTEFDKFSAIFRQGADAATDGIAAVKAGDMDRYKADVKIIGDTCNTCHATYRQRRDG